VNKLKDYSLKINVDLTNCYECVTVNPRRHEILMTNDLDLSTLKAIFVYLDKKVVYNFTITGRILTKFYLVMYFSCTVL